MISSVQPLKLYRTDQILTNSTLILHVCYFGYLTRESIKQRKGNENKEKPHLPAKCRIGNLYLNFIHAAYNWYKKVKNTEAAPQFIRRLTNSVASGGHGHGFELIAASLDCEPGGKS